MSVTAGNGTRFPRQTRLRNPAEFKRVSKDGQRVKRHPLAVSFCFNDGTQARLGLAIAKKSVAHANERNRIKRLIREDFRRKRGQLPAIDLVFYAQPGLAAISNPALRALLGEVWVKVIERCARYSPAPSAPTSAR